VAPSTPLTPLDATNSDLKENHFNEKDCPLNSASISNSIQMRYERRRTTSAKKDNHENLPTNFAEVSSRMNNL